MKKIAGTHFKLAFDRNMIPTHNPDLSFIKASWTGNPLHPNGKSYVNLDGASERGFADVLRWQFGKKPLKALKKKQKSCLEIVKDQIFLDKNIDGLTWLGHTSFVYDCAGIRLVTDPILFDISVIKRFTPLPCAPEALTQIDYILLSHNHRDHMDERSIKLLCKLNPNAVILTGLQMGKLLRKWGIKQQIVEAGWYQSYDLKGNVQVSYLPAKHWTRRYLTDNNLSLWGSFMIEDKVKDKHIYFGADSGYGIHFKDIAALFPQIDIAMLGIGAFEPYWFMHPSHTGPKDALRAFEDLKAHCFLPMHYGTFDLSDEPVDYPETVLRELAQTQNLNCVKYAKLGEKNPYY